MNGTTSPIHLHGADTDNVMHIIHVSSGIFKSILLHMIRTVINTVLLKWNGHEINLYEP
jgi:hypothetical protein